MIRKRHFVAAGALCALCVGMLQAKEDEEPKRELYFAHIEHVKPSMIAEYEAATKEFIEEFNEHKLDPDKFRFTAISGPDIGYVYVMPMKSFAAMDSMMETWKGEVEKIGEERWAALAARSDAAVERVESSHSFRRPELCYVPEHPRLKRGEVEFLRYTFFYVMPGKEAEFEEAAKEFVALYQSKDIDSGWSTYTLVTGQDLPLYIVAMGAKSASDYYTNGEKIEDLLGDEDKALVVKAMSCVRRVELKQGRLRRDLSYPTREERKK